MFLFDDCWCGVVDHLRLVPHADYHDSGFVYCVGGRSRRSPAA